MLLGKHAYFRSSGLIQMVDCYSEALHPRRQQLLRLDTEGVLQRPFTAHLLVQLFTTQKPRTAQAKLSLY
jgi:hypothetical protein